MGYSAERGCFNANSITVQLRTSKREAYIALDLKQSEADEHGVFTINWEDIKWSKNSPSSRVAFLTLLHEQDHFETLTSTPVGLLMWRCYEVLIKGVAYFAQKFDEIGLECFPEEPLIDWYRRSGHKLMAEAIRKGHLPSEAVHLRDLNLPGIGDAFLDKMDRVTDEIEVVERLRSVLFDTERPTITIGDFVDLANRAYPYLSERCEIPCNAKWTTSTLDPSLPLYPNWNWCLTIPEMMEGSARLSEHSFLLGVRAGTRQIEEWKTQNIFGVYDRAYTFFTAEFPGVDVGRIVLLLCLCSPIDISCVYPSQAEIVVEDVIPSFRLARLVQALKERGPELARHSFQPDFWCANAGLTPVSNALSSVLQNGIIGRGAFGRPAPNVPNEMYEKFGWDLYVEDMCRKFQRGMSRSLNVINWGSKARGYGFFNEKPNIEFFNDSVSLNNNFHGPNFKIYVHCLIHCIVTSASLALLRKKKLLPDPGHLLEAFLARVKKSDCRDDPELRYALEKWLGVEPAIRAHLGNAAFRSLRIYKAFN